MSAILFACLSSLKIEVEADQKLAGVDIGAAETNGWCRSVLMQPVVLVVQAKPARLVMKGL